MSKFHHISFHCSTILQFAVTNLACDKISQQRRHHNDPHLTLTSTASIVLSS